MNKNKQQTFEIVFFSLLMAIMIVLDMTGMAFINLGFLPTSITTLPIIVIVGSIVLGRKYAWILGLTFGMLSLYAAFTRPVNPFSYFFRNPFISVLPRMLFGIVSFELYNFLEKKFIKVHKDFKIVISTFLVTLIHSTLVLLSVAFFVLLNVWIPAEWQGTASGVVLGLLSVNILIEVAIVTIIAVPVTRAVLSMYDKE